MRITHLLSLSEPQFLGCAAAFVDSFFGELNAAVMALRQLENQPKGCAFAHEMSLDLHRYGALLVLDRWSTLIGTFGPHMQLTTVQAIVDEGQARVRAAEEILASVNALIDSADRYGKDLVEACVLALHSLNATFREERAAARRSVQLGPMLPDEYKEARRIFLEDLAAR